MKPSSTLRLKPFRLRRRETVQPSKPSLRMTPFFCPAKPAVRAIRARRAKISPASELIHDPASSARSAGDATAAVIAADSVDAADAPMGVLIVPTAAVTVDRIAVPIAVPIVA